MLTQIANIIMFYKNIMCFCYKLQKYIIRFVYLQQRIYTAHRVTMQKNPPQIRSAGDFSVLNYYGVIAENAL